ncbi:MAG: ribosome maturation factor RimM [Saprospiraceae bacterium]
MDKNFVEIGHTQRPHGVKGEIKIKIEEDFWQDLGELEVFFLNVKGKDIPYFVEEIRGADFNIAKFEDVNSKETAGKITSCTISARISDLKYYEIEEETTEDLFYNHCTGYEMIDVNDGNIGVIKEVLEYPQQELAILEIEGEDILLPLNEHTVHSIDNDKKQMTVEMPEGLLNLDEVEEA